MRNGKDDCLVMISIEFGQAFEAIFVHHLLRISPWIIYIYIHAILLQFIDDIKYTSVANVRTVFFEGNAKNERHCTLDFVTFGYHKFNHFRGDIFTHIVVESSACENDFRVIAVLLCFLGKVIGIDTDAVPTNKTWPEVQKIPFGGCCRKHFLGINTHTVEDHGELIDEGDVDISLRIFNDFSCFSHSDR